MNENKVTITKDEFIELIAHETIEATKDKDNLSIILSGGLVTGILCDKLFGDNDSVCISKKEYCDITATAIHDFY